MSEVIQDGTGTGKLAKVTQDNRLGVESIVEPISAERSRHGKLWGCGTGNLTLSASASGEPVIWIKNGDPDQDWYINKLIFGWNGGNTNHDRTVFSLISYNTADPTANHTALTAAIENISKSGSATAVTKPNFTGYKWDGNSTGMTAGTGGFAQIPNRIAKGNTSIAIDGEIILGPGNSMQIGVTPEEAGLFNVSIVFYTVEAGKERGEES